jgi:hypothetical protein
MPIHDWTRVNAGTFHDFHSAWIIHIKEALNGGLLPANYYAMAEQHPGRVIADILTLRVDEESLLGPRDSGTVAVADRPRVSRKAVAGPNATYRAMRRTLTIRHASNHRIVALLEILSPANKDRLSSVEDVVEKAHSALKRGCHLLVIDLFPPGPHDPKGMHGAIWESFDSEDYEPPPDKPLILAAYMALPIVEVDYEPLTVGDELPDGPLYLQKDWFVNVPLEVTYQAAYRGVPSFWRGVLEGRTAASE